MATKGSDPTTAEKTVTAINDLWANSSLAFQQQVPEPTLDNIKEFGAGIVNYPVMRNEFVNGLINRIGKVVIRKKLLENKLEIFSKGRLENGNDIEEIFTDIVRAKQFNPQTAEDEVFKRAIPNTKALFYRMNSQVFYKQTISRAMLNQAFTSWERLNSMVGGIFDAMYNSDKVTNYMFMKELLKNYYDKGLYKFVKVPQPDATTASEIVTKIKTASQQLVFPSQDFNAQAITTAVDLEDQYLIIEAKTFVTINIAVLAQAFNMDQVTFMGHVVVVDNFNEADPNSEDRMLACLIDRDFFQVYETLFEMDSLQNPEGLSTNYWLHHWQTLAVSQFSPAICFTTDSKITPVTQIIVNPHQDEARRGTNFNVETVLRLFDNGTTLTDDPSAHNTYSVALPLGQAGSLKADTTVLDPAKPVISIASDEKSTEMEVTVTNDMDKAKPVVGKATIQIK